MAKCSALMSIQISLVLLLGIFVCSEANLRDDDSCCCGKEETKMTVYLQEITGGPNATYVAVAGIPGRPRSPSEFGTIYVADIPVTEGTDINSPTVGRAQGIFAASSLDGANVHDLYSIIFTNRQYNGSTLEIQGRSMQNGTVRELSVVSGTKMFRYFHGYVTLQTVLQRPVASYNLLMCNITIRRY